MRRRIGILYYVGLVRLKTVYRIPRNIVFKIVRILYDYKQKDFTKTAKFNFR